MNQYEKSTTDLSVLITDVKTALEVRNVTNQWAKVSDAQMLGFQKDMST